MNINEREMCRSRYGVHGAQTWIGFVVMPA